MLLIDPQGNYPRYIGDLMLSIPEWNIEDPLPDGWSLVHPSEIPSHNMATHKLEEIYPVIGDDGQYYQSWVVSEISISELEIQERLMAMGLPENDVEKLLP
jgi:hypothetical protein